LFASTTIHTPAIMPLIMEHTVAIGRSICNRTAVSSDRRRHHGLPHHGLKCQSQRNGNAKTCQARFEPVSHFASSAGGKLFGPSVTPRR
jgi:hypothetical protein